MPTEINVTIILLIIFNSLETCDGGIIYPRPFLFKRHPRKAKITKISTTMPESLLQKYSKITQSCIFLQNRLRHTKPQIKRSAKTLENRSILVYHL